MIGGCFTAFYRVHLMKLTAQSKHIIRENKLQEFYLEAIHYLEDEHQTALTYYEIKREMLFNLLKKNYVYFESIHRPSKYLCVTQTTLMLYCGQFYAQSPLFQTVKDHLEKVVLFKDEKSKYWLAGIIEYYQSQELSKNMAEIITYSKDRYQAIIKTPSLLKSEIDLFLMKDIDQKFADNYKEKALFLQQAMKNLHSMTTRREELIFLCIVAQYLDGLNCFQDEFRPKWFGQLEFSGLIPWSFDLSS